MSSGSVKEGGQASCFCFSDWQWQLRYQTTTATHLYSVFALVTGFSYSMHPPLWQSSQYLLASLGSESAQQADSFPLPRPTVSYRLCLSVASSWLFSLSFSLTRSHSPPSEVSMCRSPRHVCVLCRESSF